MSLFDDDFFSPKVSSWERRKMEQRDPFEWQDRWPLRFRFVLPLPPSVQVPWLIAIAASLAAIVLAFMLAFSGGGGGDVPAEQGIAARNGSAAGPGDAGDALPAASETAVYGGQPLSVVDIVKRLKPAVVSVINTQTFRFERDGPETEHQAGIGSGVVYKKADGKGWVVTNHHVIENASSIEVVLYDGKRLNASLVGSDVLTDLAVLTVDADEVLGVAEFGDSDALEEGEAALAIGHPFGLGYSPTFTLGIISSLHRVIPISLGMDGTIDWEMELLQTDAAINHGNSGGALVNLQGKVIGINSMKVAMPGVEGLGFAIPSNLAVPIIAELEAHGKVRRPYLGVATVDLARYRFTDEEEETVQLPEDVKEGALVLGVYGPAAEAGLRTHDVIVAFDGTPIDSTLALRKYLYAHKKIGDPIHVEYYRDGKKHSVTVKLGETPDP